VTELKLLNALLADIAELKPLLDNYKGTPNFLALNHLTQATHFVKFHHNDSYGLHKQTVYIDLKNFLKLIHISS
jgi:hypothetical protein